MNDQMIEHVAIYMFQDDEFKKEFLSLFSDEELQKEINDRGYDYQAIDVEAVEIADILSEGDLRL